MTDPTSPMPRRPSEPGADEFKAHRRALFAKRVAVGATVLAVLGMLVASTYTALVISDRQQTGIRARESSDETLDAIKDCTTPGRTCYERGQRQTAGAVSDINRVVILAAACATGLPAGMTVVERQQQIQTCVIERLAARGDGP